jgi:hypothetical protein
MNIFELTAIASPLVGASAGAMAVESRGVGWLSLGGAVGLSIGVVLYLAVIGLTTLLIGFGRAEKLNPVQWLASLAGVYRGECAPQRHGACRRSGSAAPRR